MKKNQNIRNLLLRGLAAAIEKLEPAAIIFYGRLPFFDFGEIPIFPFENTSYLWTGKK